MNIWSDVFYDELDEQDVPDEWTFHVDHSLQHKQKGWLQYTQCTFARFTCSQCRRWWNSAEVHILFFMKLDRPLRHGTVKIRIFRQECKKCNSAVMENPEISYDNIQRVICNLIKRILSKIYKKGNGNQDMKSVVYSDKMEGPHDRERCEACKQQVCRWQMVKNEPKTPIVYQESTNPVWAMKSQEIPLSRPIRSTPAVTLTPQTPVTPIRSTSTFKSPRHNKRTQSPVDQGSNMSFIMKSLVIGIGSLVLFFILKNELKNN